jgi:hypothetical protein
MDHPFTERLSGVRELVMSDDAPLEEVARELISMAAGAAASGNEALYATSFYFTEWLARRRGVDPAPVIERIEEEFGARPTHRVQCTACGQKLEPGEPTYRWRMLEVKYLDDAEVVATCSPACQEQMTASGWPSYSSFLSEHVLRDFARKVGVSAIVPPSERPRREVGKDAS